MLKDLGLFIKFKLSTLVLFSAAAGYAIGLGKHPEFHLAFDGARFAFLLIGGFLITGASNGFNQIWERDIDSLMERTKNRPLPSKRMTVKNAYIYAIIMGITGIYILSFHVNYFCGALGFASLLSYVFIYTPLKKISPWASLIGAFPGAVPPLIGWAGATDDLGLEPGVLFLLLFIWQFPHIWAISWVVDDDYKKAGIKLIPSTSGRGMVTSRYIFWSCALLIPATYWPFHISMIDIYSLIAIMVSNLAFLFLSYKLLIDNNTINAKKVMFASFFYLPIVLIIFTISSLF
ncbi:MAG: protoheme IX farnesyltransferase [Flavobacteriales bacterium]|nr:protoheme IX farnesyltransferase [Flavobacteriales bacterium]